MRIGIDGRVLTDHYPGIGRALFAVLPALSECAAEIVLIRGPEPSSERYSEAVLEEAGVEFQFVPVELRSVEEQLRLPGLLRQLQLDVILTPHFASALRWPCPRVTMVHDLIPLTVPGSMPSVFTRLLFRWLLRAALASSRLILVPSRATADSLGRFAPHRKSRIRVVPHALDPRFVPASQDRIDEARKRYRLDPRYLLVVAGDRPHKNLAMLIEAWISMGSASARETLLVIAGTPSPQVEHPAVKVLGAVRERDLPALYSGAVAAVVPSLDEGFGLPMAEAMACGTAVVCSDRQALIELAGDAVLTFDPTTLDSVSDALSRIISDEDLRVSLVQRGSLRTVCLAPKLVAQRLFEVLRAAGRPAA